MATGLELMFSGDTSLLHDASATSIALTAGTKYVIGRQPQREGHQFVQLTSSAVNFSREQFTITNDGAGWQLRSEGTNATKVNGTPYKKGERCALVKDDNISVLGTQQGDIEIGENDDFVFREAHNEPLVQHRDAGRPVRDAPYTHVVRIESVGVQPTLWRGERLDERSLHLI